MKENNLVKVEDVETSTLRKMSIKEIDTYGASIQSLIDTKSSEILNKTPMNQLGYTKDKLNELQEIADKQKKLLPSALSPLSKFKRFTMGYSKVSTRLENIKTALTDQMTKLDDYVSYMMEQVENIQDAIVELRIKEDELQIYADELQLEDNVDQIRLQAVANRLKIITSTRVNAEQAQVESLMIIKSNQESKYQLAQVIQNVLPVLTMQTVNALGIKANRESMEIAEKTRKITGDLIVKNAEDINSMAKELEANRTKSPIDEEKLNKAQALLVDAMETITKASTIESEANIRVSKDLRKNAETNKEFIETLINQNK